MSAPSVIAGFLVGVSLLVGNRPAPSLTAEQERLLSHFSVVQLDDGVGGQRLTVRLEGANLQIVNGTGTTDGAPNGVGNLIVGYDTFAMGGPPPGGKDGSHMLVVGDGHTYTSFGGAVIGERGQARGAWSSVVGGRFARAFGEGSVVIGGSSLAEGLRSVSVGGSSTSSGTDAVSVGGNLNEAVGFRSTVVGGEQNVVEGVDGLVAGGKFNHIESGNWNVIAGGLSNRIAPGASGGPSAAGVFSGRLNVATGFFASVFGGEGGQASGANAVVVGGRGGGAGGASSVVVGGSGNDSEAELDTVVAGIVLPSP